MGTKARNNLPKINLMKKGLGTIFANCNIILIGTPMLLVAGEFAVRQTSWRYLTVDELPVFPKRYFQESPSLGVYPKNTVSKN